TGTRLPAMNDTNRLDPLAAVLVTAQMSRISFVFTDVFNQLCIRKQVERHRYGPRFYVSLGVINIELNFQVPKIRSDVAFDDVQSIGRRMSSKVKPRVIDESLRIDNQGVPFPTANG